MKDLPADQLDLDAANALPQAIHHYFNYRLEETRRRLRFFFRDGRMALMVGLVFSLRVHRPPSAHQVVITTAYTFGWRMQSKVLALEHRQLDLKLGAIRLEPGTTKNNEWRLVCLTQELRSLMTAQVNRVVALWHYHPVLVPSFEWSVH
jgi:hypothetical protein